MNRKNDKHRLINITALCAAALFLIGFLALGENKTASAEQTQAEEDRNVIKSGEEDRDEEFCLTATEEAYVKAIQGRRITLGVASPEAYVLGENGLKYGTCMPFADFLEDKLGTETDVVFGNRQEIYGKLKTGEIDLMFGVLCEENGTDGLWYAEPIAEKSLLLVVKSESLIKETDSFSNIRTGILKDSPESRLMQPFLYTSKETVYCNTYEEMMSCLASGAIDAAVITDDYRGLLYEQEGLTAAFKIEGPAFMYTVATAKSEFSALLSIFNRYLLKTREGSSFHDELDANRLRYDTEFFKEKEKELIKDISGRYNPINVYLSSVTDIPMAYADGETVNGIYPDMIDFFRQATGIDFAIVSEKDEDSQMYALSENEIQAYCGLVKTKETEAEFDFSDACYKNYLVAAVKAENEECTFGDIRKMTWGVLENTAPLLETSVFAGHLNEYRSEEELFEAAESKEVDGIVVKQTAIDGRNLSDGTKKYKTCANISIPAYEYIAFGKNNGELNVLLKKLVSWYRLSHPDYENEFLNPEDANRNGMVSNHLDKVREQKLLFVLCIAAGLLFIYAVGKTAAYAKEKRLLSEKLRIACPAGNAADIIELDIKKQTMRSSNGFLIFNLSEKDRRESYTVSELSRLTGVDFKAHYDRIIADGKKDFENDFLIYSRDCRYSYRETGTITGNTLISAVTKVNEIL